MIFKYVFGLKFRQGALGEYTFYVGLRSYLACDFFLALGAFFLGSAFFFSNTNIVPREYFMISTCHFFTRKGLQFIHEPLKFEFVEGRLLFSPRGFFPRIYLYIYIYIHLRIIYVILKNTHNRVQTNMLAKHIYARAILRKYVNILAAHTVAVAAVAAVGVRISTRHKAGVALRHTTCCEYHNYVGNPTPPLPQIQRRRVSQPDTTF